MHRFETYAGGTRNQRSALNPADHPDTLRMLALMGGHERIGLLPALVRNSDPPRRPRRFGQRAPESDRAYFRRRSREERSAADRAAVVEAREAHEELADLYAGLSDAIADRREHLIDGHANSARPARARRRNRQDALLDEALKGTFPASDPVSVAFIR